ncbi:high-affinity branched-chain amino acid ABC transporter ATP-binding protein LivG [Tessaracoccus terricola]
MSEQVLRCEGVTVRFGGLLAVNNVSFTIDKGTVFGLLGPNGAGKSTLFNSVTGVVRTSEGRVELFGNDVTGLPAHSRMRTGVARTFQLGGLIKEFTVLENVVLGIDHKTRIQGRRFASVKRKQVLEEARQILDDLQLSDYAEFEAGAIGSGTQRAVEVARCVASGAELILLDEPGVGLTPPDREFLKELVWKLADQGSSVLITDHDTDLVLGTAETVLALDHGTVLLVGSAEEVRNDQRVIDAYLGTTEEESA